MAGLSKDKIDHKRIKLGATFPTIQLGIDTNQGNESTVRKKI